ncbi:hypothetical protein GCM10010212_39260 [Paenarthrobacter nicotinovorans]|nr:hypothetical protein GCM10010212_39260 [Paenarthrobacter nicotinovorans]
MPVVQAAPGFDLGNHQGVTVDRDDVYLTLRTPPIAINDPHPLIRQEIRSQCLAILAKPVFCSHDHHLRCPAFRLEGVSGRGLGGYVRKPAGISAVEEQCSEAD